ATFHEQTLTVDRGVPVTLTLPPRQTCILEIRTVSNHPASYDLPDPAIGRHDIHRRPDGRIFVTVHNVGVKPVENLVVRVTNARGELITEQTIDRIEAPLDLRERVAVIVIPNEQSRTEGALTITLDPDHAH